MKKTIQIADKYKPLMDYYDEKFDKEEFNHFITKLLITYKKMKDKNIDLITFSELIEFYDVDIIDLIKIISENANMIDPSKESKIVKNEKKEQDSSKTKQNPIENPILNLGIDLSQ